MRGILLKSSSCKIVFLAQFIEGGVFLIYAVCCMKGVFDVQ